MMPVIRRALLSVSDKSGIVELAKLLHAHGVELLSTGGTAGLIAEHGVPVTEISDYTDFPEIMSGRVKTLHPKVYGGILARRGEDEPVMEEHAIQPIDLVVVNLYPFQSKVADPDCRFDEAIENIDIGGPAMIRAAAKNHASVTILVNPEDYQVVSNEMAQHAGGISAETRFSLALKAYQHTAIYDDAIVNYLKSQSEKSLETSFPRAISFHYQQAEEMRYGENPHQSAVFYTEAGIKDACIATARQLQGQGLSYNNIADTDAALECVKQFEQPACVIVKHANPCGVAVDQQIDAAYQCAFSTDPESAFGGIIAFNRRLDAKTAQAIIDRQFAEVIIAPSVDDAACAILSGKKNLRLLSCGQWSQDAVRQDYKRVTGGLLVQDADTSLYQRLEVVSEVRPDDRQMQDLLFAWKVVKFVKSNAIVYARDAMTIGVGAGQMSRINSARIAAIKAESAKLQVVGSVMASDAFLPFRDAVDAAREAGICAIIQPGGSRRDAEIIAAANEHGLSMVFTGMRHFKH